jgi:hypothetical protein
MTTNLDPLTLIPFTRVSSVFESCKNNSNERPEDRTNLVLRHRVTGTTSIIYHVEGLIIKTMFPACKDKLENIYQHLIRTRASSCIPKFYGYFRHRRTTFIILSDEGMGLETFDGLSERSRYVSSFSKIFIAHINSEWIFSIVYWRFTRHG